MFDFANMEGFEWDKGNINKNWISHEVLFSETEEVFFNKPLKIMMDFKHSTDSEKRYQAIGVTNEGRLLCLIFTIRSHRIRVISARDMSRPERSVFNEK